MKRREMTKEERSAWMNSDPNEGVVKFALATKPDRDLVKRTYKARNERTQELLSKFAQKNDI